MKKKDHLPCLLSKLKPTTSFTKKKVEVQVVVNAYCRTILIH